MGSVPMEDFRVFKGFTDGSVVVGGSSLVLDGERGELVKAPAKVGKKGGGSRGVLDERTAMALKSHSEAERRRRERINSHLATLRSMVPCTEKLDKAALLAEVINHVKELKSNMVEASKGCTIPSDADEVTVETEGDLMNNGSFVIRASLCCEDRPELFADIRQTLQSLQLRTVQAEISTLGGRVKNVFVMTFNGNVNDIERHLYTTSVHQALKSVLDRVNSPSEFLPRTTYSSKRQRISTFESSSSSS